VNITETSYFKILLNTTLKLNSTQIQKIHACTPTTPYSAAAPHPAGSDAGHTHTHTAAHLFVPGDDIGAKAQHEGPDEGADLLGGSLSPALLFVQTPLAHAAEGQCNAFWLLLLLLVVAEVTLFVVLVVVVLVVEVVVVVVVVLLVVVVVVVIVQKRVRQSVVGCPARTKTKMSWGELTGVKMYCM